MSTMDPTGDGGGGGTSTSIEDNVTPGTPSTDIAVPPGSQHQHHPPPSPLSGCYLLVVLPEPHTAQHRDLILNRLAKGFLSWDKDSCHVDLEKELQALVAQAPEGEEARNGERLIQYATENLVTEVLIHPQTNTLLQCMRNLLASFTKHRHIIHAGYTFGGNGSWILQDGTFSLADFLDAFSEHEVQRVLRAYENSVTVDINCAGVGEWSTSRLSKEACTRSCRVRLNPDDVLTAGVAAITSFTNYVGQYLLPQTLDQLMEPSDVVGNIRFSHPTLYVFPGGQGDAALFGINGFNMLVDGGFARKACFWDFARHLDRLDAVLVTRVNNSNVGGMSSVLRKKREMHVYPQIGHFFCNLVERRHSNSPDGDKDLDPLTLNLIDIGQEMMVDLRQINLRAHPCYRDPNPINLYHKVGHGTLDMYVLSPSKDSREVREFLSKWHSADSKLFAGSHKKDSNNLSFPIQNLASICALLVWQPANPEDTITRILFPGSTPQHKIFEGFERLKHLEFLKHPVCTAKNLSPSTSLLTLKDRPTIKQKLGLIEKESKKSFDTKREKRDFPESKLSKAAAEEIVSKPTPQTTPIMPTPKAQPPKIDVKTKKVVENKKIETESKKIEKDLKETKKDIVKKDIPKTDKDVETKKTEVTRTKSDGERTVPSRELKTKAEPKKKDAKDPKLGKISKIEMPPKSAAKPADKKPKPAADKKDTAKASPPTPKKTMNGAATKAEVASKATPRPITRPTGKQPLSSMPAKSAKDANNRKVVEQKNIEIASAASAAAPASAKLAAKPKTSERKPISRRPKPVSPSKARVPGSPAKSTRSTPTTSVKSDKDGVIRKVKGDRGTTDSSTVSTPSGIEIDSMTKLADKSLTEKSEDMSLDSIESKVLADLKEEREVVEEIEAVLQKAERIEEARKDDHLDGDDDITAEATDKKEDDMTEDDVTADIEEAPKKKTSRKPSQELTEEDEYLIVEKEEIYIEDSAQSGEGEQKHVLDAVESEKVKPVSDVDVAKEEEEEEAEISEEKEKSDVPEKKLLYYDEETTDKEKEADEMSPGHKEQLKEEMKDIIASAAEIVQKAEDKDDSGKKDSEDITKEPSSLSPDKFDSSEKKTTDTDPMKPEVDQQKDQQVAEKLEESQERISTLESGATTTAPTLPEDERIPLDDIKEVIDEKYVADEDKDKDSVEQVKESLVASVPVEPKPDVKSFQVRPALQGIQREIVKTPDEVADLPVHEEVDPKLYRMEDFEKAKEDKPSVAPPSHPQEAKEPPTPPVKEQKGVFSFFGKVADKFEKGMDKLTGKSRRDSEKDIDEKSSSKSSSPKEAKIQEIAFPSDVQREEITEALAKPVKAPELSETFEKGEPEVSKIKVAAITDTAAFLQREIDDQTKSTLPEQETKGTVEVADIDKPETQAESKPVALSDPVFETCVLKGQQRDILTGPIADVEDDVEDVEALLEEASKKFKTVKDSLRDSLESLEDKIVEEEMIRAELAAASKDVVKDTLSEVVEKLEEIKPQIEEATSLETKEPEKVKFEIPKSEELEVEEDLTEVTKDFKEAVRDVGEVLAGSAGILIEEKPKDVIEIVKKVAEELKKDDFLSHDVLFVKEDTVKPDDKVSDSQSMPIKPVVEEIIPKKVGVTEELPPQEEIEEMLESGITTKPLGSFKPPVDSEVHEEPCIKTITSKGIDVTSPIRDLAADKIDAMKICSDLMAEDTAPSRRKRSILDEDQSKSDVMEAGIESVCVKEEVKQQTSKEDEPREIEGSDIVFDRKLSPDKAQMVIVTPDSAPTSPQFPGAKIHTKDQIAETSQLPSDIQNELDKDEPLEKIIENLVFNKKAKITIEIVEYITVVRKIPREKIIYIVEEIIMKKRVPRDTVVADLDLLKPDTASNEKRAEIEEYIDREYITKNKKITINIVEEISIQKFVTKRIVIEIIEEIIVKKKIPRDAVLDISESELARLRGHAKEPVSDQDAEPEISQVIDDEVDEIPEIDETSEDLHSEIEKYIIDDIISKGIKVTPQYIDDISIAKRVPRRVFIEILEEVILKRKLSRSSILDISEKQLSEIIASEKEDEVISEVEKEEESDRASVTSETRLQIEKNIIDEYITKNRRITPYIFEEMCVDNKASRRTIIQIIEELIVKHKVPRSSVLDISEIELEELLAVEDDQVDKESIVAASEDEDEKHSGSEIEEFEAVSTEKLSEIENSIIDEFISKSKRITPYIFEDICVRYKIPRRILIEIIEEIIIKRKIRRGSILDITDVELSELLVAAEAGIEEDEPDVKPIAEPHVPEEAGEDKLVDGFVSIPAKTVIPITAVLPSKTVELAEPALKESEKDVADDFEAVEQEYKIHGTQITTSKEPLSKVPATPADEEKLGDGMEEAIDEDVSDVVEADEKTVGSVAPLTVPTTITEKKTEDISESSETVDATEKYLIEAHEKSEPQKHSTTKLPDTLIDDVSQAKHEPDTKAEITPQKDVTGRKDSVASQEHEKDVREKEIPAQEVLPTVQSEQKTETLETDTGADVEVGKPSAVELKEPKESKEPESEEKSPVTEDKIDTTRVKRSIDEEIQQRKDSLSVGEHVEAVPISEKESPEGKKSPHEIPIDDGTAVPISTVHRLSVTATSDDGKQEKEVGLTGSITLTATVTPDDSLKTSPVKTSSDQGSLHSDKESLRTGASTPEKDSVSGKSTPGTKDGEKITPEDSLMKSPSVTRDSQDLEDSLEKMDSPKLKQADKPISPTKTEQEVTLSSKISISAEKSEEIIQSIVLEKEPHVQTISDDKSSTSEIADTTEEVATQEKPDSLKHSPVTLADHLLDDVSQAKVQPEKDAKPKSITKEDTTGRKDSIALIEHEKDVHETEALSEKVTTPEQATEKKEQLQATAPGIITEPSTAELEEEPKKIKEQELPDKSPVIDDEIDISRVKRSIDESSQQRKDSLTIEEHVKIASPSETESSETKKIADTIADKPETAPPISAVHRMLVTASSEDGGQEKEVCPTEGIDFTATKTPEDSLKTSPVKTTPEKDSLPLDKESVHTGASTPEKDSISGKSTPGTTDGDKITPEDSLVKSPSGSRDSQELEGSVSGKSIPETKDVAKIIPEDHLAKSPSESVVSQDLEDSVTAKSKPETKDDDKMTLEDSLVKSPSESQVSHDFEDSISDKTTHETKDVDKITHEDSALKSPSGAPEVQDLVDSVPEKSTPVIQDGDKILPEESLVKSPSGTQVSQDLEVRSPGKLTPETKDDDKIMPEVSQDKSPLEIRDSPDLEDSLAKSTPTKEEKAEQPEPLAKIEKDVTPSKLDAAAESVDKTAEAHEKEPQLHTILDDTASTMETADTSEKIEAEAPSQKHSPVKPTDTLVGGVHQAKLTHEQDTEDKVTPQKDTTGRKESVAFIDHEKDVIEKDVLSTEGTMAVAAPEKPEQLQADDATDDTSVTKPSSTDLDEDSKKSKDQELIEDDVDTTRVKRSIDEAIQQRKDSLLIQEHVDVTSISKPESPEVEKVSDDLKKEDQTAISTSTVHRKSITTSSDDGKEEKEVHPSETITLTATQIPDDKSSPDKTTPDKDSLLLDKESLRTGASTPEKDSVSGKSTPGTKVSDKITPEDSLVKSISEARDLQDLEDSLGKSDSTKAETEKPKSPTSMEKEVTPSKLDRPADSSDETVKAIIHDKEVQLHQTVDDKSATSKTVDATEEIDSRTTPQEDTSGRKDSVVSEDHHKKLDESKISSQEESITKETTEKTEPIQMDAAIGKEASKPSTKELAEVSKESEKKSGDQSPVAEDKIDSLPIEKHPDTKSTSGTESPEKKKISDDIAEDHAKTVLTGTVHRMLVIASSEDDGQEKEVFPSESTDFTASKTPDDSLRSSPIKTTPDQDSLLLDKESLHTGASTPEKDSVSGKSTPGTKDGDKITPEDSLDKSPLGTRDSQDLEDSLAKSDSIKVDKVEKLKTPTEIEQEVMLSKTDVTTEKSDETVKEIIHEKESLPHITSDEKTPTSDTVETEKHPIEAQEKDHSEKLTPLQPSDNLVDDTTQAKLKHEQDTEIKVTPQTDTTGRKDSVVFPEHQKEISELEIVSQKEDTAMPETEKPVELLTGHDTVVETSKPDTVKSEEEPKESKDQESRGKSPVIEDKIDITQVKSSIEDVAHQRKDSLPIQEHAEVTSTSKMESPDVGKASDEITKHDETAIPTSTVHRMSVSVSSEHSKQENELHLTESTTVTATKTPDDSLKSSPIKTTPDKDSLHLGQDSLRTGASTPEKDSVSGKSTPGTKDGDKITPEDSLDKSPLGTRASQDLEDSLAKSDSIKVEKEEKPETSTSIEQEVEKESHISDSLDDKSSTSDKIDTTEKYLIEPPEKIQSPQEDTTGRKDSLAVHDHPKEISEHKTSSEEDVIAVHTTEKPVQLQTDDKTGTDVDKPSAAEIEKERRDSKVESEGKSPVAEDGTDITRVKRSIDEGSQQRKDSLPIDEHAEASKTSDEITKEDETVIPTSTVHRMSIIGSTDDSKQEKELHLTATKTPDDSLKSSPIKTTPDKDSLLLDKESLRTGASTPEKDSVSDKSSPGTKVSDKTTPEASLVKSPSGTQHSQDVEEVTPSKLGVSVDTADKTVEAIHEKESQLHEVLDDKSILGKIITTEEIEAQEKVQLEHEKDTKTGSSPQEDTTGRKDSIALQDQQKEVSKGAISRQEDLTSVLDSDKTEKERRDSKELESARKSPEPEEKVEVSRAKRSIDEVTGQRKDSLPIQEPEAVSTSGTSSPGDKKMSGAIIDGDETAASTTTLQQMSATPSSEDSGQEKKIDLTGSVTSTTTITPEDSLKSSPVKTTLEHDALIVDKESLRTGASTPEKDSVSDKSTPGTKSGDKITTDDGLDKSPSETRDSQGLEDSLAKTDKIDESATPSKLDAAPETEHHDTPKDRSRSQSVFDAGEKTPVGRSRTASLFEDSVPEALSLRSEFKIASELASDAYHYDESDEAKPTKDDLSRKSSLKDVKEDMSSKSSTKEATDDLSRKSSIKDVKEDLSSKSSVQDAMEDLSRKSSLKDVKEDMSSKSSAKEATDDLSRKSSIKDVKEDLSSKSSVKDVMEDLSPKSSVHDVIDDLSRKSSIKDVKEDLSSKSSVHDAIDDLSRKSSIKDVKEDLSSKSSAKDVMEDLSRKSSVHDIIDDLSRKSSVKDVKEDLSPKSSVHDAIDDLSRKSSIKDVKEDLSSKSSVQDATDDLSRKSSVKDVKEDLSSKSSVKDVMEDLSRKSSVHDIIDDLSRKSSVKDVKEDLSPKSSVHDAIDDLSRKSSIKDVKEDLSSKSSVHDATDDLSRKSSVKDVKEDLSSKSSVKDVMEDLSRKSSVHDIVDDLSRKSSVKDVKEDLSPKSSVHDAIDDLSRKSSIKDVKEDLSSKSSVHDATDDLSRKSSVKDVKEDLSSKSSVKDVMEDLSRKSSVHDIIDDLSRKSSVKDVKEDLSPKSSVHDAIDDLSRKSSIKDVKEDLSSKSSVHDATDDLSRKSSVKDVKEDLSSKSSVKDVMEDLSRKSSVHDIIDDLSRKSSVKDVKEDLSPKSSVHDAIDDLSRKSSIKDVKEDLSSKSSVHDATDDLSRKSSVKDVKEDLSSKSSVQDATDDQSRKSSVKDVKEDLSSKSSVKDVMEDLSRKSSVHDIIDDLSRKSSIKDVKEDLSSKLSVKDVTEDLSRKSSVHDATDDLSRKSSVKDVKEDLSSRSSVKDVMEDISRKSSVHDAPDDLSRKSSVKDVMEDLSSKLSVKDVTEDLSRKSSVHDATDDLSRKSSVKDVMEDLSSKLSVKDVTEDLSRKSSVHDATDDLSRKSSVKDVKEDLSSRSSVQDAADDQSRKSSVKDVKEDLSSKSSVKDVMEDISRKSSIHDATDDLSRKSSVKDVKEDLSSKSSVKDVMDDKKDSVSSDSRKSSLAKFEDATSKRSSVAIPEDISGQFAEDYHTTIDEISKVEEYIVNKYIIKKEKITSRVVEEIVMLYSMPKYMILELIEAIIMKKNVPRDFVVDYPKFEETSDSAVTSKDDHVDVIDISPAKRQDIESYIQEEFITKHKKISSKLIDDLATLKSVSRYIIIMIIEEIITKRKIQRSALVEDGVLEESSKLSDTGSYGPMEHEDRLFDEENLPSISTEFHISSRPSISSSDIRMEQESGMSEQKRVQVETYVMEECVKKGKKITVLVLEQIMAKMSVSRSDLLDIIENIIITRKMSRKTMVDDAIYDEVDVGTSKSPEILSTKDRIVEFSGKSTPDPKSSGYSTPENRQYDDKFSKEMSSYSTDYESPFHKAFVGGMTEIRTTHITTLSGKSTPDLGARGETPESLSDSITSSSQTKAEEKVPFDKEPPHTSANEFNDAVEQAPSISTVGVAMTTTSTTASSALGSAPELKDDGISVASEKVAGEQAFSDEKMKHDTVNIESKSKLGDMPEMTKIVDGEKGQQTTATTKIIESEVISEEEPEVITRVIRREVIDEEEPEVITRVIRREVIDDEEPEVITRVIRREVIADEEPEVITRVIRREVIDDDEPEVITRVIRREVIGDGDEGEEEEQGTEVITRVIRREIIDQDDDIVDGSQQRTISRRISNQDGSEDMFETITTRTTKTIVTDGVPHVEKIETHTTPEKITSESGSSHVTRISTQDSSTSGPISADIKRTITTVTTVTDPDGKVTTKKDVQESTDTLEGDELLEKLIDSTKTDDNDTVTDATSIESLKTEKIITETIKPVSPASATGVRGDFDSGKSTPDSALRDEKYDTLSKSKLEKPVTESVDHAKSPTIKDIVSDERSYSGKSSPDMSLPKDIHLSSSTGKSTPDIPVSPFTRDGGGGTLVQTSGRSTPDRRADSRSSTATPEGFRSSEVIRTTITTTRTMSEDGDIITTTKEITEATNEKGEVTILKEKTDVKVEDRVLPKDIGESSPKSDHSSMHSRAGTHAWGSSEDRHTYSDDEVPGSPLSTTSQVGYSPQSTYHFGEQSFGKDSSHKSIEFSEADMSSSFYGELPDLPPRVTTLKAAYLESGASETSGTSDQAPTEGDFSFKKFTVEKELAGGFSEKSGGRRYVDDADLDFEKALMERKEMKRDRGDTSSIATSGYTNGNLTKPSSSSSEETKDSKDDAKKDPLEGWGTPLGLPSPKPPRKFNLRTTARPTNSADISPDSLNFDAINDWGEPLRLPSPAPVADEASNKGTPVTPKKERKQPKKVISENIKNRKRSESPSKNEKKTKDAKNKVQPVYMDLTYVPHHGNSYYTSLEFFKRVRARYYVFSGTEPSREVYDALLDAKKTWEDKDLEVTMIPTYDTDTLGYWVADNEEALAANHIDLSPSASRCTINLQDHETSCSAYRLEF